MGQDRDAKLPKNHWLPPPPTPLHPSNIYMLCRLLQQTFPQVRPPMATKRKATTSTSVQLAKRKKARDDASSKGPTRGRPVRERAEPYRLATARFPVDALTPVWREGSNRELDIKQVRDLCESFGREQLLRESEENRLRVCCSRAEVERMTAHLAATGDATSGAAPSLPSFHDWVEVNGCRAELMAGQHRVAALRRFLQKEFPNSSSEEHWWACDIYDRGRPPTPPSRDRHS
jgi:hypothetical protein